MKREKKKEKKDMKAGELPVFSFFFERSRDY